MRPHRFSMLAAALIMMGLPHAARASESPAPGSSARAPETLVVRFYAKVYLLPTEDSPLLGLTQDGVKLPVYRRKGAWVQVPINNTTGWTFDPAYAPRAARTSAASSFSQPESAWIAVIAFGITAFLILILVLLIRGMRGARAGKKRPIAVNGAEGMDWKRMISAAPVPIEPERRHGLAGASSLEGKITANGLAEILQFLEVGRRNGMLSLEDGHPAGLINFEAGAISFAQTRDHEGLEAVMDILALKSGAFRFFADKRLRQSNCRLSTSNVLMQWACRMDEMAAQAMAN